MQRENKLSNIIMTDPVVRDRLTRHLFDRAMKRIGETPKIPGLNGLAKRSDHAQGKATKPSDDAKRAAGKVAPKTNVVRVLRIANADPTRLKDRTATHLVPSSLGGVFRVEVMRRDETKVLVRIHMPKTEWHHWQGAFWVDADTLSPI